MRAWLARARDWLRRDALHRELDEELRHHRQLLERDGAPAGRLGNLTSLKEATRDAWSLPWLDQLLQDVRYALRGMRRSPGFAATVIVTLGLGIGANAAMFGLIDRLMFRPYPYLRDQSKVSRVYFRTTYNGRTNTTVSFSYTRYLDLAQWTSSFSQVAAFVPARHAIGVGESAREQPVVGVTASFFGFFDARPAAGRFFGPAEDSVPFGANVAVLGFGYWQSEFGGRDVLGQEIQVGRTRYTVIGVAPKGFVGIAQTRDPAVFIPITAYAANEGGGSKADYYRSYNWDWVEMIVRSRPGVSSEGAAADLTSAFVRSRVQARAIHPNFMQVERLSPHAIPGALRTAAGPDAGLEARTLLWVTGVAGVVLLIACANVANLYLARAFRRRREVALRLALGVSRRRLVSQSLTESLVLSLLGCALGVLVAQWGGAVLRQLYLPLAAPFDALTDTRTLGLAVFAALLAAALTGVAPVALAGQRDIFATLKAGGRDGTPRRSRLRTGLLIAQAALSVTLLVGAGLFVKSLGHVLDRRTGFDADPVITMHWERRGAAPTSVEREAVRRRVLDAARAIPGVANAAWVTSVPMQGTSTAALSVPGIDSVASLGRFNFQTATPGYFDVVNTRIIGGRAFSDADHAGTPRVAVVSESMARTIWAGREALGQCMHVGFGLINPDTLPCTTVIGIAEDVLEDPVNNQPNRYYLPDAQFPVGGAQLLLRLRGDAVAGAEAARRAIQRELPGLSFLYVQPMREMLDGQRKSWRMGATMFVAFGLLALVVASVGLYGVIAYDVAQRMHELGVRIALGAQGRDVVRLVVGQGVSFAIAGAAIGLLVALWAAHWIQPLLFEQSARDPVIYGAVAAIIVVTGLMASALPAFRAMRADPNSALRSD